MDKGWIKLHRKLMRSALWRDCNSNQKVIMVTLLMMASHDDNTWIFKGEEYTVQPGQFVTSLQSIADNAGVTVNVVRKSLTKLEKYGFCTNKSTNKNRLITIENWAKYQEQNIDGNIEQNKQGTSKEQARNNYQECKNDKNVKKTKNNTSCPNSDESDVQQRLVNEIKIAEQMSRIIKEFNPTARTPNSFIKWAEVIDRLIRLDKRTPEQIIWLFRWSQNNDFWNRNIRSPDKLRKHWERLVLEAKGELRNKQPQQSRKQNDLQSAFDAIDRLERMEDESRRT